MAKQNNNRVVTGVVRLSYANVWEPKSINGGDPKYSCSIIIPKTDTETVNAINAAIDCAIKEGIGKFGGKVPPKGALKLPLRDGDTERDDDNYAGCYFINANSKTAPQIVDKSVRPILDRSEVYSGVYAKEAKPISTSLLSVVREWINQVKVLQRICTELHHSLLFLYRQPLHAYI